MSRQTICQQTSQKLAAAASGISNIKATVGFDGFVDEIIAVVDKRHDFERYDPIRTIEVLGNKITNAAGKSSNYELIVKQMKLGGNGPIMANALASAGINLTYIGNLGYPAIHPVFQDLAHRSHAISIGEPGHTDALEFDDGKLLLGKITSMNDVNWPNLVVRVGGEEKLRDFVQGADLIAMVNWTMLPYMSDIWEKMLERGYPARTRGQSRTLFVDLADPEKRNHADIVRAMDLLTKFEKQVDVALGLNLKEAGEIADVFGIPITGDPEAAIESTRPPRSARSFNIGCVVIPPAVRPPPPLRGEERKRHLCRPLRRPTQDQHRRRRPFQRRLLPRPHPRFHAGRKPLHRRRHQRLLRPHRPKPLRPSARRVHRQPPRASVAIEDCRRLSNVAWRRIKCPKCPMF